MRCLITGATGFVGRHLARHLRECGHDVVGLSRSDSTSHEPTDFPSHAADLNDAASTEAILRSSRPERIFHLAGFASPGESFRNPSAAWAGNLTATMSLYDAIARTNVRPRILYVSSGLVYGDATTHEGPFTESSPLRPTSPYAASKAAADLLSYQQTRNPALDIVRVRPFNQIGPGQSPEYAASNFARQIAAINLGQAPPRVETGDLNGERDLTDVRDMVRAYVRLLESGKTGEVYNAASGSTIVIRDLLDRLIALAKSAVQVCERTDPSRSGDAAASRANISKIREAIGWKPEIPVEQTLSDMLEDWRRRLSCLPNAPSQVAQ